MLKAMCIATALGLLCGLAAAQSAPRPKFFDHARVQHGASGVTIVANSSLPLAQAIEAIRLEYGWQINWESAPGYSHFDVVDDTGPKWRASHPGEKGVTRPSGGSFVGTFPEPGEASDAVTEHDAIARLIDEYNATDNPGKYILRTDSDGGLTVVGTRIRDETGALREASPLLDTPVTLAKAKRNVYETIELLLDALQSATGKKVIFAVASSSLFINTLETLGGERIPARELLRQALASTQRSLQYDLGFNPDVPVYILSVSPAMKEESDGLGGRKLVPVAAPTMPR
jgi:hypothetical protein